MESEQREYDVRCEWGERGLEALEPSSAVLIVIDVLSFSTCVDIATSRGASIFPYRWRDASAAAFAKERDADLAGPRGGPGFSLSPETFLAAGHGARIVLSSPNGAALSVGPRRAATLAGCLRNASAVAAAAEKIGGPIAILPAGERWSDGSLRPALEDWLGAGAIAASLGGRLSPEAAAARALFASLAAELSEAVRGSVSGRQLIRRGYPRDVELASQLDVSTAAPVLADGAYTSRPGV